MMSKVFTTTFVIVLTIQLLNLNFSPIVPELAIGEIVNEISTPKKEYRVDRSHFTTFSSLETTTYESIIFVGDVMLGRHVERLMNKNGIKYPFLSLTLSQLAHKSAIVGNFEASIPKKHIPTPNYQLRFSVPTSSLPALLEAGFTHVSLANNHSRDHGEDGFTHSQEALRQASFVPFGSELDISKQSVTYINTNRGKVALIGLNASSVAIDHGKLNAIVTEAQKQSFLQIAYIHWGIEYELQHSQAQKRLATVLVKQGIDLIIGHHPHVVQDIDSIDGVPVFYSLGNYIFDQYFSLAVQEGLVLSLDLFDTEVVVHLHPISSVGRMSQPYLLSPVDSRIFLSHLAKRSHVDLRSAISAGKIIIPLGFATSSKIAMISP